METEEKKTLEVDMQRSNALDKTANTVNILGIISIIISILLIIIGLIIDDDGTFIGGGLGWIIIAISCFISVKVIHGFASMTRASEYYRAQVGEKYNIKKKGEF